MEQKLRKVNKSLKKKGKCNVKTKEKHIKESKKIHARAWAFS